MTKENNENKKFFDIYPFTYIVTDKEKKEVAIKSSSDLFGNFITYNKSGRCDKIRAEENVEIPEIVEYNGLEYSVISIGCGVFDNCDILKTIRIPSTIKRIEWCFWSCRSLIAFEVDNDNPYFCDIEGLLYNKDKTHLIAYPCAKSEKYEVPIGVTTLISRCFKNCNKLKEITLPNTLRVIGPNVFYRCTSLKEVRLPTGFRCFKGRNTECIPAEKIKFIYKGESYSFEKIEDMFKC